MMERRGDENHHRSSRRPASGGRLHRRAQPPKHEPDGRRSDPPRVGATIGPLDGDALASFRLDERTGLPTIRSPRPVTAEDVQALEDE
jgi:hypothetical protein